MQEDPASSSRMTTSQVTHPDTGDYNVRFERDWATVSDGIRRYCLASARNYVEAQDLFQIVAIRAWRGYPSLTDESNFAAWVRAIARNEAARLGGSGARKKESLFDDPGVTGAAETAAARQAERLTDLDTDVVLHRLGTAWLRSALGAVLDDAVAAGDISRAEAEVVRARVTTADGVGWRELGERLGQTGTNCAVLHFRAMGKLRVFVFRSRPEVLGGLQAVRDAFESARAATPGMTAAEAEVFDLVILQGRTDYRRRGWQTTLRSAVDKVARHARLAEW